MKVAETKVVQIFDHYYIGKFILKSNENCEKDITWPFVILGISKFVMQYCRNEKPQENSILDSVPLNFKFIIFGKRSRQTSNKKY